jgi:hypothetical protein
MGKLGLAVDGPVLESMTELTASCFAKIRAMLTEGSMGLVDICHVSAWLTDRADLPGDIASRDVFLFVSGVLAASVQSIQRRSALSCNHGSDGPLWADRHKKAPVGGTQGYRSIPSESVKASSMSTPR